MGLIGWTPPEAHKGILDDEESGSNLRHHYIVRGRPTTTWVRRCVVCGKLAVSPEPVCEHDLAQTRGGRTLVLELNGQPCLLSISRARALHGIPTEAATPRQHAELLVERFGGELAEVLDGRV